MKIKLGTILGGLGTIILLIFLIKEPIFIQYFVLWTLPGLLLSYNFDVELKFLERLSIGIAISNIFLILFRIFTTLNIPFGKNLIFLFSFVIPIMISLINYKKFVKGVKGFKFDLNIFIIALAVLLTFFIWSPLLQDLKLPLTDQVVNQAFTNTYIESIEGDNKYPFWSSEYSLGFPLVLFDSPFYYERIAFTGIQVKSQNLTHHMNYYAFFNFVMLLLGIYSLARRLDFGRISSIFAMILFITNPLVASKAGYSGDIKELVSFAIFPVMFIIYMLALEKKKLNYFLLLGVLVASYYFTNLVPLIPTIILMVIYFVLFKLFKKEFLKKKEIIGFGVLAAIVFFLVGFQMIPMIASLKYVSPSSWTFEYGPQILYQYIITPMFSNPVINQYTHNMGLWFSLVAVAGMIASLLIKFRSRANYMLIAFWITILCYLVPLVNIMLKPVETHRLILLILLIFSLFIARLFDMFKKLSFYHIIFLGVFLLILIPHINMTRTQTANWVNEQAQNGLFKEQYQYLEQYGPGRLINYGIFAFATEPYIPALSNLWMITHTNIIGVRTIPQYEFKDGTESGVNTEHNITYILNRMRTTFTKYIVVVKNPARRGDVAHTIFSGQMEPEFDSPELSMFVIPNSTYIHSVVPIKTQLSKEQIYSAPEGWKVYVLNSSNKVINSVSEFESLPQPRNYDFKTEGRGEIEIYGEFDGGWIVVKDHYYPTWRAYMNGKELRIEESNLGTMLIKTEKGNKISMTHKQYAYEPVLSVLALITLFAVMLFTKLPQRTTK